MAEDAEDLAAALERLFHEPAPDVADTTAPHPSGLTDDERGVVTEPIIIERPSSATGHAAVRFHREADGPREQSEPAGEDVSQSARLELVETQMTELARTIDQRLTELAASVKEALDRPMLKPELVLDERFALLARTVEQMLEDARSRPRNDAGAHDAADIASIRRDIEAMSEALSRQEWTLAKLASTFDWLTERMLPR